MCMDKPMMIYIAKYNPHDGGEESHNGCQKRSPGQSSMGTNAYLLVIRGDDEVVTIWPFRSYEEGRFVDLS